MSGRALLAIAALAGALFAFDAGRSGADGPFIPLMPGNQAWGTAASFDFGTNDTIEYQSDNVDTVPSVGAALGAAHVTLMRTWAYETTDTDATIAARLATITGNGMTCMFMLGTTTDLTWMEHVVGETYPTCKIYEFGNEPDNSGSIDGSDMAVYTDAWIADVPALRAIAPDAVFGGPALTWSSANGSAYGYPSDMAYFLATTEAAGVRADFISYHDYPCEKSTSEADCLTNTPGDFAWNWGQVIGWENAYYGAPIPTGVSEYNFDPGSGNLYAWGGDDAFMKHWEKKAVTAIVAQGMAFANEFTSLNGSGFGYLDMFGDSAPYAPKGQFNGLAAEIALYRP